MNHGSRTNFQVAYLSEKRAGDAVLSRKQQTDGDAQPRTMDSTLYSAEKELLERGYDKNRKYFLKHEVELILKHFGEP